MGRLVLEVPGIVTDQYYHVGQEVSIKPGDRVTGDYFATVVSTDNRANNPVPRREESAPRPAYRREGEGPVQRALIEFVTLPDYSYRVPARFADLFRSGLRIQDRASGNRYRAYLVKLFDPTDK